MKEAGMVVIGAGEAGARAVAELRERGWAGAITLIGNEGHCPYERPPLSKRQLTGEDAPAPVTVLGQNDLERLDIRFERGDAAVRIDRDRREVELASGRRVPYERLLLATGAAPRQLAAQGSGAGEILYLRRFEDMLRLRDRLRPGARAAIIGGGFIGLEAAASALALGCAVTLIEVAPRILTRGVPEAIARRIEARHREAGVMFRIGTMLESIDREGDDLVIRLADGSETRCDAVIAGIGAVPETALAAGCGLTVANGIVVNERLQTSDPAIYAAGDCCSFPHPLYGGRHIRLEAWRNAQDQGMHAAAAMLGADEPYAAVPWFWSDQYELSLQVAGLLDGAETTVVRELGESGTLYFHLADDGRLLAASGIGPEGGVAKDIRLAEMLIARQARPLPEALADPAVKLKQLLRD
ncbi:MAG: FAD-dependent oxidoreductase [Paenibacillaceae bacterium]|nr:FAD-dependent oxidoreductase [Paenibacillaceae bacterium]